MSNQPSTIEVLRTTAAEATHTIAETIDPSPEKEASGWRTKGSLKAEREKAGGEKGTYKEQLHQAAKGGPDGLKKQENLVSKAMSYIPGGPALEKAIYGSSDAQINAAQGNIRDDGTPPTRPQNDTQVEEFLKEQYKSKQSDVPEIGADNGMTGA